MISRKDDTPFSFDSKGQYLTNFTSLNEMSKRKERKKKRGKEKADKCIISVF